MSQALLVSNRVNCVDDFAYTSKNLVNHKFSVRVCRTKCGSSCRNLENKVVTLALSSNKIPWAVHNDSRYPWNAV